jgi:hypothetical protein
VSGEIKKERKKKNQTKIDDANGLPTIDGIESAVRRNKDRCSSAPSLSAVELFRRPEQVGREKKSWCEGQEEIER